MTASDLLRGSLDVFKLEDWHRGTGRRTSRQTFAVYLHATGCSFKGSIVILQFRSLDRTHGAVWNWVN